MNKSVHGLSDYSTDEIRCFIKQVDIAYFKQTIPGGFKFAYGKINCFK